jgi:hypothetical protein
MLLDLVARNAMPKAAPENIEAATLDGILKTCLHYYQIMHPPAVRSRPIS